MFSFYLASKIIFPTENKFIHTKKPEKGDELLTVLIFPSSPLIIYYHILAIIFF